MLRLAVVFLKNRTQLSGKLPETVFQTNETGKEELLNGKETGNRGVTCQGEDG